MLSNRYPTFQPHPAAARENGELGGRRFAIHGRTLWFLHWKVPSLHPFLARHMSLRDLGHQWKNLPKSTAEPGRKEGKQ